MLQKLFVFCLLNFVYLGSCGAPTITKCTAADSDCILKSAQALTQAFVNGVPEWGVEKLDPVSIKKTIDASAPGLSLKISDQVITGLKTCVVQSIHRDKENSKIGAKIFCDRVETNGQYEMEGKLLIINVAGKGKLHTVLNKHLITVDCDMEEKKGKDGKTHWDIKRFTHTFELQEKAELVFENLFTGSEVLGKAANDVIESSSNEIITEVGHPVIKAVVTEIVKSIKHMFKNVPAEDLALD